jgi:hypothetical protein
MNLKLTEVTAALLAAIAADLGTFDLSATDAVQEGWYALPPASAPFACVYLPSDAVESIPVARERWFNVTAVYTVTAWAPFTAETSGNRQQRASLLADEIKTAIETARRTAGNNLVKLTQMSVGAVDIQAGAESMEPGFPTATFKIAVKFRRSAGVGA